MATSIFFDGRTTSIPGAYTKIDASGLDTVGVGATGIVALIGTAVGGQPVDDGTTEMTADDLKRFITPQGVRNVYQSGNLREAGTMAFNPSTDPDIPGGAQQVVCLKVNPSTQSSLSVADIDGGVALTVKSEDYGAFTEEVNITITDGTAVSESINAKNITVKNTTVTETYTNVGEVSAGETQMLTLRYDEPTSASIYGWTTMTSEVISVTAPAISGLRSNGSITLTGTTALSGKTGTATIASAASNAGKTVAVFGTAGAGLISQSVTLDASGAGTISTNFSSALYGIYSPDLAADATITWSVGGAVTLTAATKVLGGLFCQTMYVANTTVSLSNVGSNAVVIYGLSETGAVASELVAKGTTSSGSWSRIDFIGTEYLSGGTPVLTGVVALSNNDVQSSLQKVRDYYNARQVSGVASAAGTYSGFTFVLKSAQTTLSPALLDVTASALDVDGTVKGFPAILNAVVAQLNASALVSATRGTTNKRPANIATPSFLSGGIEGIALASHYQTAIDLLKTIDVSTIVPLTGDSAVHAALNTHCVYMSGAGKSERDGIVGLVNYDGLNPTTNVPTKSEIKSQVLALNSRHLRACGQSISRFNTAGTQTVFPPYFQAVIAAAMQAGSSVGTSLTRKTMNVIKVAQDSTWSPANDSDEMITAGLWFAESHRTGIRCVRNITTYLQDNNLAFTEASVNEAANVAVFNFRNQLEKTVGRKGFAGTLAATRAVATQILDIMVSEGVITQYQSLTIELNVDTLVVAVEIAPIIPINFVTATVHLVTVPISG
jgi:hypothetical protein